jgi:hypothetical protein
VSAGFPAKVRIGRRHLHAGGQFVTGDAGVEVWLAGPLPFVQWSSRSRLTLHLDNFRGSLGFGRRLRMGEPVSETVP